MDAMMTDLESGEMMAERMDKLNDIGVGLKKKVLEQVALRSEIEDRWLEDMRQYNGRYDPATEAELRADTKKSRIYVNKTRSKTNAAEARLGDMVLPTDDRNWALKPTPNPVVDMAVGSQTPTQEGLTAGQVAEIAKKTARDRARLMQSEIDDQLNECRFNHICRQVIHDAALLGTGILKGPVIIGQTRKSWKRLQDESGEVYVMDVQEENKPIVERVDPWDFFPDLSAASVEDAEYILERSYMTRRRVRELMKRPGFEKQQILRVLTMDPKETQLTNNRVSEIREIAGITSSPDDTRYEAWSYYGALTREELEICGCEFQEDDETPYEALIEAVVWFIGDIVIKAVLNPMDTEDRPFSVMNWESDETSIFGFGVPYQLRNAQKVINAAWRMTLDNAGLSTGPQIVINQDLVEPADGEWAMHPRKVWRVTDRNAPVGNAFATFDIASHQQELMNIFGSAMRLADEETNLPVLQEGEGQQLPQTMGAHSMMQFASNVVLRRVVKHYDDYITVPTIRRFYDWNMQYNPNEDIKGDYEVDARGSTSLMAREMQTQNLIQWMGYASNPVFAPAIKVREILQKVAIAQQIPHSEVVKTEEEMQQEAQAAAENQPQDPMVMKAELEFKALQYKMQMTDKMNQDRLQSKERELMMQGAIAQKEHEIQVMKMMMDREMSAEEVQAELAKASMKINADNDREMMKTLAKTGLPQ